MSIEKFFILLLDCSFVNDVRLRKRRKSSKFCRSVLLTQGGRSPTGVSKTGRLPVPDASESAISIQAPPSGFCWRVVGTASSEAANPHKNRTSGNYRTAPGRFCGCVLPCHYARAFWDGLSYGQCEACCTKHPKDEYDSSLVRE